MNSAQPIKDLGKLEQFENYYMDMEPHMRNHVLLTMGLNTALRISDLLALQWKDVYDFSNETVCEHITLTEQKTRKKSSIFVNIHIRQALIMYRRYLGEKGKISPDCYLFPGQKGIPLSRVQAWRIIKKAAESCHISGVISPHSMRKTFGYHAWKQGIAPALLMEVFNHSTFAVTRRYLGIGQDDRDEVFKNIYF